MQASSVFRSTVSDPKVRFAVWDRTGTDFWKKSKISPPGAAFASSATTRRCAPASRWAKGNSTPRRGRKFSSRWTRGRNQRGMPRARDPRATRGLPPGGPDRWLGAILYGRTNQQHAVYTCGRYMRTAGAECASNQVDAEAMLRFTLLTLKQFVDRHGRRDKLRQKLLERALQEGQESARDPRRTELARLQIRQTELQGQHAIIEYRMARERDDALYAALSRQYQAIQADLAAVAESIRQQEAVEATVESRSARSAGRRGTGAAG